MNSEPTLEAFRKHYEFKSLGVLGIDFPATSGLDFNLHDIFDAIFETSFFVQTPRIESIKSICLYGPSLYLNYPPITTTQMMPVRKRKLFGSVMVNAEVKIPRSELIPSIDLLVISDEVVPPKAISIADRSLLSDYPNYSSAKLSIQYIKPEDFVSSQSSDCKEVASCGVALFGATVLASLVNKRGLDFYPRKHAVSWREDKAYIDKRIRSLGCGVNALVN